MGSETNAKLFRKFRRFPLQLRRHRVIMQKTCFGGDGMATLEDIAKALGVSKSTVSKALSGAKDVGAAMRQTVVEKAVETRLNTDRPLGTFLSGGVDSCIVTGIAARLLYPAPCNTFTAAFSTAAYDEREAAKVSANINA